VKDTGFGGEGSDRAYHWGRMSERDAIVAWLRDCAALAEDAPLVAKNLWSAAESIEDGLHRREGDK